MFSKAAFKTQASPLVFLVIALCGCGGSETVPAGGELASPGLVAGGPGAADGAGAKAVPGAEDPVGKSPAAARNEAGRQPPVRGDGAGEGAPEVQERRLGGIAAIVGNKVITRADLKKELIRRITEITARVKISPGEINRRREEKLLLEQMINRELILQAALGLLPGRNIETGVPLEIVMNYIDRDIEKFQKTGYRQFATRDDYFARYKSEFGTSREDVIRKIRETILTNDYLYREVLPKIDRFISPVQSRAYYRSHREKFSTPEAVVFQQIVFSADFNLNEKIRLVNEGLAAGQPFGELAVKYSEEHQANPKLRARLDTVRYSDLDDYQYPIPQVLKSLSKGQVSGPHRAKAGVYFFRMADIVKGEPRGYEQAQEEIESTLLNERHRIARAQDLRRLREASHVEIYLDDTVSTGPENPPAGAAAQKLPKNPVAGP